MALDPKHVACLREADTQRLKNELDEVLAEGGTSDDMRDIIAAGYLEMALNSANHELELLALPIFDGPSTYCRSALRWFEAREMDALRNRPIRIVITSK